MLSTEMRTIKNNLLGLLNTTTSPEVLALNKEFETASNKQQFFAAFEADAKEKKSARNPQLLEQWLHYRWIRLELSYLASQKAMLNKTSENNIQRAIHHDAKRGVPIEKSIHTLSQCMLEIVGTEHPTDPLSQTARNIITQIANATDELEIKRLLAALQKVDPIPAKKRSVEIEVKRNTAIVSDKLYDVVPKLVDTIFTAYSASYGEELVKKQEEKIWRVLEGSQLMRPAAWAGFDADGNTNVDPDAMATAIDYHCKHATEKHVQTLNTIIRDITAPELNDNLIPALQQFQQQLREKKSADINQLLDQHAARLEKFPEIKRKLRQFGLQLTYFGMTYGVGHVRQDSKIFTTVWNDIFTDLFKTMPDMPIFSDFNGENYANLNHTCLAIQKKLFDAENKSLIDEMRRKYQAGEYNGLVKQELDRLSLAARDPGMVECVIISNTQSASDILGVESLLRIFTRTNRIRVIPLVETPDDLRNLEKIFHDYVNGNNELSRLIEFMFGYSDTERVYGLLALMTLQEYQERFLQLAKQFNLDAKIFHGPGGDVNRGGLQMRPAKGTLQGNARSNVLNSEESTLRYLETLFAATYQNKTNPASFIKFNTMPLHIQKLAHQYEKHGSEFYVHLHDTENGLGKLLGFMFGQGINSIVEILNSSSRASQRGGEKNKVEDRTASVQSGGKRSQGYVNPDKLRAITATQVKEMLRDYLDVIGAVYGLRKLDDDKKTQNAEKLYDMSATVRDIFNKILWAMSRADLSITSQAFFAGHPEFLPRDHHERKQWAKECRETYPAILHDMKMEDVVVTQKPELMRMLSRFFALIEEEYQQSYEYMFRILRSMYPDDAPARFTRPTDLLFPFPEAKAETEDMVSEVEPLSLLLARLNRHLMDGRNLDELYLGVNEMKTEMYGLSGVGRLIGNIGAGITAFRMMSAESNIQEKIRCGVVRAEQEAALHKRTYLSKSKLTLLNNMLRKKIELKSSQRDHECISSVVSSRKIFIH